MIPSTSIDAWGQKTPWPEPELIEQDLILSRAIVALFQDPFLRRELRFRGGTALSKLHFPKPFRYSEDIDLVRTTEGPIGKIFDHMRKALEPWLGEARFDKSRMAPKLRFQVRAEADHEVEIKLKVETNISEIESYDPPVTIRYDVENPWFSGSAEVSTFSREEILASKMRALLQRDKGRDLFDLAHGLEVFQELDTSRVVQVLGLYFDRAGQRITRAQAEIRMFEKLGKPSLVDDIRPLLPLAEREKLTDEAVKAAFVSVFTELVARLPGKPWALTPEMSDTYGVKVFRSEEGV